MQRVIRPEAGEDHQIFERPSGLRPDPSAFYDIDQSSKAGLGEEELIRSIRPALFCMDEAGNVLKNYVLQNSTIEKVKEK